MRSLTNCPASTHIYATHITTQWLQPFPFSQLLKRTVPQTYFNLFGIFGSRLNNGLSIEMVLCVSIVFCKRGKADSLPTSRCSLDRYDNPSSSRHAVRSHLAQPQLDLQRIYFRVMILIKVKQHSRTRTPLIVSNHFHLVLVTTCTPGLFYLLSYTRVTGAHSIE